MDRTIELCRVWSRKNSSRFKRLEVLEYKKNSGIVANINRGVRVSKGVYFKSLAGDDLLVEDCIEKMYNYSKKNKSRILFSNYELFGNKNIDYNNKLRIKKSYFYLNADKQYKKLLKANYVPAPTSFIERATYDYLGGFDEKFSMLEDWPFWIKATNKMIKLDYMDNVLVRYRVMGESVSNNIYSYNERYIESLESFYRLERKSNMLKNLNFLRIIYEEIEFKLINKIIEKGNNKKRIKITDRLMVLFSPIHIALLIKQVFRKIRTK